VHGTARQQGQVMLLFCLVLPLLLAALGLAIEAGYALAQRQRMQAAADAAALNGSYCLVYTSKPYCQSAQSYPGGGGNAARGMAMSIAKANGFDSPNVTVTTPYNSDPHRIAVTIGESVPTTLLQYVGFNQFALSVKATAATTSDISPASVLALAPTKCGAVSMTGNASIDVDIGIIQVNSSCASAVTLSGSASIAAAQTRIVGNYSSSGNAGFSPAPTLGVAPLADPLASVNPPSITANLGDATCGSNQTLALAPGIYTRITATGNCVITLQPGTYAIAGGGISISGNASISGNGVLLYNSGSNYPSSGGTYGAISLSGNGSFNLAAATSGPYKGLLFFQDRANPQTMTLSGNGAIGGVQGTIYGPSMPVSVTGTGSMSAQFIVDSAAISGNGSLVVQYDPSEVYGTPAMSLVE
jgi:Flp pilus assembly protein TadG